MDQDFARLAIVVTIVVGALINLLLVITIVVDMRTLTRHSSLILIATKAILDREYGLSTGTPDSETLGGLRPASQDSVGTSGKVKVAQ
jgi:hypothetical protein